MADYFTNFSFLVPLPDEAAQKYALDLASAASSVQMGDEPPDSLPASFAEVIEDWQFDTEADHTPAAGDSGCTPILAVSMRSAHSSNICCGNLIPWDA